MILYGGPKDKFLVPQDMAHVDLCDVCPTTKQTESISKVRAPRGWILVPE